MLNGELRDDGVHDRVTGRCLDGRRQADDGLTAARGKEPASVETIGHGTVLSDRYRLAQRIREDRDGTTWRGVDELTGAAVSVLILSPEHAHTADVVDAALRATDLDDPRLVRVLGAGTEP